MASTIEIVLTIIALSFWFLFPIGMFISMSHVDKNTDQVIQLEKHRFYTEPDPQYDKVPKYEPVSFDWHHPFLGFRRWLHHE